MPNQIAVVIPCYKVSKSILGLVARIGPEAQTIYIVDDHCPEQTGSLVRSNCRDPRVRVIENTENQGVGGAVMAGYQAALKDGAKIVIKLDGDGQMDPAQINRFAKPIEDGSADYTKGNRFFSPESLIGMPPIRVFGNAMLSFINKAVSGYWNLMDPTNGYTAIHASVLKMLPLEKIDKRYFFESDMLFRLNTVRAVVAEVPMDAVYAGEHSSLNIARVSLEFPRKYLLRIFKRIFYSYFLRDFNICSLQLIFGTVLLGFGVIFGMYHWINAFVQGTNTPLGTVMLAALPVILGFQLLLSAITFDAMNIPRQPLHPRTDGSGGVKSPSTTARSREPELIF